MIQKSVRVATAVAMLAASASLADAAVTQLTANNGAKRLIIQTEDTGTYLCGTIFHGYRDEGFHHPVDTNGIPRRNFYGGVSVLSQRLVLRSTPVRWRHSARPSGERGLRIQFTGRGRVCELHRQRTLEALY